MQNQKRVVIDYVSPSINGGDFYIKRVVNEVININAHILADGHDILGASILYKHKNDKKWKESKLHLIYNNEWEGSFLVEKQGFYEYKIEAWVDYALNWQHGIERKINDDQYVDSELLEGIDYLKAIKDNVEEHDSFYLDHLINIFNKEDSYDEAINEATSGRLNNLFFYNPKKILANTSKTYKVYVDRKKARFSTWYEFFPRSASEHQGVHGTFKDCERLLPRVSNMGFDTLYLPPIHPIGEVNRKGKNNAEQASEGDVGSTWGVGSKDGGHKAIHPQLGSLDDFKALINKAKEYNIEVAMDYALQAAPDHPWVKEHPSWFKWRPDGTVQYAENPPKKYQDILPIYWESKDYTALWQECLDVFIYWIKCGVEIFRVDNPHTKPFYFWNWIINKIKTKYPNVIFLAEAFTAPKVMKQLAKQGYTQSYTYFTWRNDKQELIDYIMELTHSELSEYMQPNFWPNTPDINPYHLQGRGFSKHTQRYALAATLSSSIGIYGPVFEYMLSEPLPGKEEYLNSEKYQLTHYDWTIENDLIRVISKINQVRHENPALQQTNNITFAYVENENLLAFYKWNDDKSNEIFVVISLDDFNTQEGTVQLPLHELGINKGHHLDMLDLITDTHFEWHSEWNYVKLDPTLPFHILKINK